jgi:hypothetical protein
VIRLLDDYSSVREDSDELDEGQAGRSSEFYLAHPSRRGYWSTRSPASYHTLMVGKLRPVRTLGSVLSYLMHGCTKGLCANPTDLFFQKPLSSFYPITLILSHSL